MQVVAKTPSIDVRVEGKGMKAFLDIIKKSIPGVQIIDDDDVQNIDDWDYYKEMKSRVTPAKVLKIRRENAGRACGEVRNSRVKHRAHGDGQKRLRD